MGTQAIPATKRVAVMEVSPAFLVNTCKAGRRCVEVIDNPLPDDATVAGAEYDTVRGIWRIVVESASFEEVPPHASLPVLPVTVFRAIEEHNHE